MRSTLFLCFLAFAQLLFAQSFSPVLPLPPFENVENGSVAFADVNGDNTQDVLITGSNTATLYTYNGGIFTEVLNTPFEEVRQSAMAFADVNGDNTQDVLITGFTGSFLVAKLYTNGGNGNFTEVVGTPFEEVMAGSIAFADVNGDNTQDVLITGFSNDFISITKLYTNDGAGNFTEVMNTPFVGVQSSSIAFADVNGDQTQDVLITGDGVSKLYTNDGSGNFTEVMGTPFDQVSGSSVAFSDVNGDNTQDVLITGFNDSVIRIAKLYTNDGSGNFTEKTGTPFSGVNLGSVAFADVNGDNTQDVLITGITGMNGFGILIAKLYTNDGSGNFTEVIDTPFDGLARSSIAFSDLNGDQTQDVIITGGNNNIPSTKLYYNDGSGNFAEAMGAPFPDVHISSIAFADVNGDSTQDVFIAGWDNHFKYRLKLFTNDGNGNFIEKIFGFDDIFDGSIAFADVNGDSTQDLIIAGAGQTYLYTNDGNGNFTEEANTPFDGVWFGSVTFADVNGDNAQDLLITGEGTTSNIAKLYINDGNGNFTLQAGTPFEGVKYGSVVFADINGDNTLDVLITGEKINDSITRLYTNDGTGHFTEILNIPFNSTGQGSIAFSDVNGDNTQDLMITESDQVNLYTNDGNGNFTKKANTPFDWVNYSSIVFADINGDQIEDVFIMGLNNSGNITKLYTNDGLGNFSEVQNMPFDQVGRGSLVCADVDGDGDSDVLIAGQKSPQDISTRLYLNTTMPLSISKIPSSESHLLAYPNPSEDGFITLDFESKKDGELKISLFDLTGKRISHQEVSAVIGLNSFPLDYSFLGKGVYFIKVDNESQSSTFKLAID